jgi:peptidoglycan-associated lipoprotein
MCLASLAMGCGGSEKPASAPVAPTATAEVEQTGLPGQEPDKATVVIDQKILDLCDIPTPKFAFDSSALSAEATAALNALAACFLTGKAQGKNMNLVGHCDPRGTEEYNMALGQRRADSVGSQLQSQGLGPDRMQTSSRGELDATGTDEPSWALDRKVQIFLAE